MSPDCGGCWGEVTSFYIPSFHESRATTSSPEDDRRNGLVLSAISQLLGNTDSNNVPKDTRKFIEAGIASKDVGSVMKWSTMYHWHWAESNLYSERREMTRPSLQEGWKGYLSYLSIVTMDVDVEDDSYADSSWIESAEDVTDRAINIWLLYKFTAFTQSNHPKNYWTDNKLFFSSKLFFFNELAKSKSIYLVANC